MNGTTRLLKVLLSVNWIPILLVEAAVAAVCSLLMWSGVRAGTLAMVSAAVLIVIDSTLESRNYCSFLVSSGASRRDLFKAKILKTQIICTVPGIMLAADTILGEDAAYGAGFAVAAFCAFLVVTVITSSAYLSERDLNDMGIAFAASFVMVGFISLLVVLFVNTALDCMPATYLVCAAVMAVLVPVVYRSFLKSVMKATI